MFKIGGSLLLTIVVVKYAPENLSPELLSQSKAVLEMGFWQSLYGSFERLIVGLLIHSCFTAVVLLSLIKSQKRYLLFAMLWHFGHDMIGQNLHYISEHWIFGFKFYFACYKRDKAKGERGNQRIYSASEVSFCTW